MLVYWLMFALFAAGALLHRPAEARAQTALPGHPAVAAADPPSRPARHGPSLAPLLAGLLLLAIIGLRYEVGGDWYNYLAIYNGIARQDLGGAFAVSLQEPAYTLINWLAAQLGAGMWLVNLVCALPFVAGTVLLSRQQTNFWLALLVATPFLIIVVGMGYTRQASALGFLMIACAQLIRTRSMSRFVGWVIAGALFHQTVLVFVPVIMMTAAKNRQILFLLGLLTLVVGYYTILPSALDRYSQGYLRSELRAAGAAVRVVMNLVPAILLLFSGKRLYRSFEEQSVWRTFAIMAILAAVALPLVPSTSIVDRFSIYLIPLQMFVLARLPYTLAVGGSGSMWRLLVVIYTAAVMFVWLNYAVNAAAWLPYHNYLGGTA
jgi:hypothetical protein